MRRKVPRKYVSQMPRLQSEAQYTAVQFPKLAEQIKRGTLGGQIKYGKTIVNLILSRCYAQENVFVMYVNFIELRIRITCKIIVRLKLYGFKWGEGEEGIFRQIKVKWFR